MTAFGEGASFRYIDLSAVSAGRVAAPQDLKAEDAPSRARQRVSAGDTLFSCVRVYLENIAFVPPELDGQMASTAFAVLRPREGIDARYLYWLTRSPQFLKAMTAAQRGNSPPAVQEGDVRGALVPIAPPAEQPRIAKEIDTLFTDLDTAEAALGRAREGVEQFRASLLHAACTGALTAAWREANPPTETGADLLRCILAERRATWERTEHARLTAKGTPPKGDAWKARYVEPTTPDLTDAVVLPEGWVWSSFDALVIEGPQNGLYLPKDLYGRGTPILRIDDFQSGWIRHKSKIKTVEADATAVRAYALCRGDIVINRVNSMTHLGKSTVITVAHEGVLFESNMMRVTPSRRVSVDFLSIYLRSGNGRLNLIRDAKWAVNQASINQQDVRRAAIPLPSFAEQEVIAAHAMELLSEADQAEADIDREATLMASLRQSILHAAFTGRLVPQDPADEPAAALLARLRAAPPPARRTRSAQRGLRI
jgi:type I restriction enzyme S subunit